MSKMFQIHESDLAELEAVIPQLSDALMDRMDNRLKTQLRRAKRVLSDVRWNYGPPETVETIEADDAA